jgi:Putative ATPase subunit of terminase (gpP-like)
MGGFPQPQFTGGLAWRRSLCSLEPCVDMHGQAMLVCRMDDVEIVGVAEIAELLGVRPNTVTSWRQRDQLPRPRWSLKSGPVWRAADITSWYRTVKRVVQDAPAPDQIAEAIDLTGEPGRTEVYAHYGLAMGIAQLVEQHLSAVLTLLKIPDPYDRQMFFEIVESANRQTMGQLKEALRRANAPVIGITYLERVVNTRNLLAHRYFVDADRSVRLNNDKGRAELISELDAAARDFFLTVQHLRAAEVRLAIDHGLSKADVMKRLRELRKGATPDSELAETAAKLVRGSPHADRAIEQAFDADHGADPSDRLR